MENNKENDNKIIFPALTLNSLQNTENFIFRLNELRIKDIYKHRRIITNAVLFKNYICKYYDNTFKDFDTKEFIIFTLLYKNFIIYTENSNIKEVSRCITFILLFIISNKSILSQSRISNSVIDTDILLQLPALDDYEKIRSYFICVLFVRWLIVLDQSEITIKKCIRFLLDNNTSRLSSESLMNIFLEKYYLNYYQSAYNIQNKVKNNSLVSDSGDNDDNNDDNIKSERNKLLQNVLNLLFETEKSSVKQTQNDFYKKKRENNDEYIKKEEEKRKNMIKKENERKEERRKKEEEERNVIKKYIDDTLNNKSLLSQSIPPYNEQTKIVEEISNNIIDKRVIFMNSLSKDNDTNDWLRAWLINNKLNYYTDECLSNVAYTLNRRLRLLINDFNEKKISNDKLFSLIYNILETGSTLTTIKGLHINEQRDVNTISIELTDLLFNNYSELLIIEKDEHFIYPQSIYFIDLLKDIGFIERDAINVIKDLKRDIINKIPSRYRILANMYKDSKIGPYEKSQYSEYKQKIFNIINNYKLYPYLNFHLPVIQAKIAKEKEEKEEKEKETEKEMEHSLDLFDLDDSEEEEEDDEKDNKIEHSLDLFDLGSNEDNNNGSILSGLFMKLFI